MSKWFNRRLVELLLVPENKKSLLLDILEKPYYQLDTSQDPYHLNFAFFIREVNKLKKYRLLELGARTGNKKSLFSDYEEYIGFDIHPGDGVDVVGDCHHLSTHFPVNYFDAVFSIMVFEHLAMPWKVILEINKIMKPGGLLFIATTPAWPPHALPWDFWRFSKESFNILLNPSMGFEILKCDEGLPCSILPLGYEEPMIGMHKHPANLAVSLIARKCQTYDERLVWDVEIKQILDSIYPFHDR